MPQQSCYWHDISNCKSKQKNCLVLVFTLGNPKAVAHIAVDPQYWFNTVITDNKHAK